jgi:titin
VGGAVSGSRDLISGNAADGVLIDGSKANVVAGDWIGTDATGAASLSNGGCGVRLQDAAQSNTIGGTAGSLSADVISGDSAAGIYAHGVLITGAGTTGNVVEGDFIGTDRTGKIAVPNGGNGVQIQGGATGNTVGGTVAAARNIISGNAPYRVDLSDPGTVSNAVEGDYIGTNAAGNAILGTGAYGVWIGNGASYNFVGAPTASGADVIAGSTAAGVAITGPGTGNNVVAEDEIGVNAADNAALGNQIGVILAAGASINLVDGCVISGNVIGVEITDAGTTGNAVEFNHIGTDATGTIGLGNSQYGIVLNGTSGNFIGYDTIANSGLYGILILGSGDVIDVATITFSNNKDGNELAE